MARVCSGQRTGYAQLAKLGFLGGDANETCIHLAAGVRLSGRSCARVRSLGECLAVGAFTGLMVLASARELRFVDAPRKGVSDLPYCLGRLTRVQARTLRPWGVG